MMEEQHLMEYIKDKTVFASQDLPKDLARAREGEFCLEYVLPDGLTSGSGFIREPSHRDAAKDGKTRTHQVNQRTHDLNISKIACYILFHYRRLR